MINFIKTTKRKNVQLSILLRLIYDKNNLLQFSILELIKSKASLFIT